MKLDRAKENKRKAESRKRVRARAHLSGGEALRLFRDKARVKKRRQRASKALREGRPTPGADRVLDERAQWGIETYVPREFRVLMNRR